MIGTAGWGIPTRYADEFPGSGTHLDRYSRRFMAVEINSSFYKSHRPTTYARWAASVPAHFRFAIKLPREITHVRKLANAGEPLEQFFNEIAPLASRLGPVLVQLAPSLSYDAATAEAFLRLVRQSFTGHVAWEPRHASWFEPDADALLCRYKIARVAADPARVPAAARPGGWPGLAYYRLHGSPRTYYSAYEADHLNQLATALARFSGPVWCIFDNTASGAAAGNALELLQRPAMA
jgi:uncharacterized protein YecE (DUF72 family)